MTSRAGRAARVARPFATSASAVARLLATALVLAVAFARGAAAVVLTAVAGCEPEYGCQAQPATVSGVGRIAGDIAGGIASSIADGSAGGSADGISCGLADDIADGIADGIDDGIANGIADGNADGISDVSAGRQARSPAQPWPPTRGNLCGRGDRIDCRGHGFSPDGFVVAAASPQMTLCHAAKKKACRPTAFPARLRVVAPMVWWSAVSPFRGRCIASWGGCEPRPSTA